MDQYWSSYVSAKFDVALEIFQAKTGQAISRLILDLCRHIIHINVSHNIIYHGISQESKKQAKWTSIMQYLYANIPDFCHATILGWVCSLPISVMPWIHQKLTIL